MRDCLAKLMPGLINVLKERRLDVLVFFHKEKQVRAVTKKKKKVFDICCSAKGDAESLIHFVYKLCANLFTLALCNL